MVLFPSAQISFVTKRCAQDFCLHYIKSLVLLLLFLSWDGVFAMLYPCPDGKQTGEKKLSCLL